MLVPWDFSPAGTALYPLAYVGRARAAARLGDVDASRQTYEELFKLWQDADSDLIIVRNAKREYEQLVSSRPARDK